MLLTMSSNNNPHLQYQKNASDTSSVYSDDVRRGTSQLDDNDYCSEHRLHAIGMRRLGPNFQGPGPNDVLCARGKSALNHPGNRKFRTMIKDNLENYSKADTKQDKSHIVSLIVDSVRLASPDGGFVKQENGIWYEVGDHIAREKCGQWYVHMKRGVFQLHCNIFSWHSNFELTQ